MIKPDEQTLVSFARLSRDPDGQRLIEWMKESRIIQWKNNDRLRGEDAIIGRGKSAALTEIIEAIEGVEAYIERKEAERNRIIPE